MFACLRAVICCLLFPVRVIFAGVCSSVAVRRLLSVVCWLFVGVCGLFVVLVLVACCLLFVACRCLLFVDGVWFFVVCCRL